VFWRRGYEDTSVADLTETMGINPPSLYAAFGNKEGLFRKAVERYEARRDKFFEEAFAAPSAREAMERLLKGTADRLSDKRNPTGCLMVQGALCGGEACESVKQDLATRRAAGEGAIRERLKRAKREGDLPADADPAALASYVATVMQGMSVRAAGGASRKDVETALRAWPVQ